MVRYSIQFMKYIVLKPIQTILPPAQIKNCTTCIAAVPENCATCRECDSCQVVLSIYHKNCALEDVL